MFSNAYIFVRVSIATSPSFSFALHTKRHLILCCLARSHARVFHLAISYNFLLRSSPHCFQCLFRLGRILHAVLAMMPWQYLNRTVPLVICPLCLPPHARKQAPTRTLFTHTHITTLLPTSNPQLNHGRDTSHGQMTAKKRVMDCVNWDKRLRYIEERIRAFNIPLPELSSVEDSTVAPELSFMIHGDRLLEMAVCVLGVHHPLIWRMIMHTISLIQSLSAMLTPMYLLAIHRPRRSIHHGPSLSEQCRYVSS